ncbi:MAG: hypothetical protein JO257_11385 [Deltaproteobacteria bacterium]|nr:hypothetical protein [Deltaproteobacteria bacterium]
MIASRYFVAAALLAGACGGKLPGGHSVPGSDKVPSTPAVPGGLGGASGEVDPNTCGNYAASDAGAKLKAFLQATKDLQTTTAETAKVVKQSCVMMGQELGMSEGDLNIDDTNAICAKVFQTYKDNLKVSLKAGAKLKIKYTPAKCTVDANASAGAGGACAGGAQAGTGGSSGGGECKAAAAVNASVHMQCTEPELTIDADAKVVVDKSKLEATLKAARDGLPKLLSISARIKPLEEAVNVWAKTAADLKDMGPKFAQSFKDQAMCITGQIAAAANAATNIHAEVSVSVQVSASASGSVGG